MEALHKLLDEAGLFEGGPGSGRHPEGKTLNASKLSQKLTNAMSREKKAEEALLNMQKQINNPDSTIGWNSPEYKKIAAEYSSAVRNRQKTMRDAKKLLAQAKKGDHKIEKEADKTGVKAPFWFYGVEAFSGAKAEAKPQVVAQITGPAPADDEAQKLLISNPDMPAATLLNALKSKGIKLVDEKETLEADNTTSAVAVTRAGAKKESALNLYSKVSFQEGSHTQTKNAGVGPIRFKVALIQEGLGNMRDGFFYGKDAIQSGIQAFEGRKCFADHPSQSEEQDRPERSVRDIIGHFENVAVEENEDKSLSLVADLVMPPDPPFEWARALVRQAAEYNKKYPEQNLVGLSINASGDAQEMPWDDFLKSYDLPESCKPKLMTAKENGMDSIRLVSTIKDAVSCDLVTEPGAKGKVIDIIENESPKETGQMKMKQNEKGKIEAEEEKKMMMAEEEEEKKETSEQEDEDEKKEDEADDSSKGDEDHADEEQDKKLIMDMIKKHMGDDSEMESEHEAAAMEAYEAFKSMGEKHEDAAHSAGKAMKLAKHMASKRREAEEEKCEAEEEKHESDILPKGKKESEVKMQARIAFLERELSLRVLADFLDQQLKESGLGRAETDKIRKIIGTPKSESEIKKTIKIFKEAFACRSESVKNGSFFVTSTEKAIAPAKKSKVSFGDC
jgi:hypothetical protein